MTKKKIAQNKNYNIFGSNAFLCFLDRDDSDNGSKLLQ